MLVQEIRAHPSPRGRAARRRGARDAPDGAYMTDLEEEIAVYRHAPRRRLGHRDRGAARRAVRARSRLRRNPVKPNPNLAALRLPIVALIAAALAIASFVIALTDSDTHGTRVVERTREVPRARPVGSRPGPSTPRTPRRRVRAVVGHHHNLAVRPRARGGHGAWLRARPARRHPDERPRRGRCAQGHRAPRRQR